MESCVEFLAEALPASKISGDLSSVVKLLFKERLTIARFTDGLNSEWERIVRIGIHSSQNITAIGVLNHFLLCTTAITSD